MARRIPRQLAFRLAGSLSCSLRDAVTLIFETIDHSLKVDKEKMTPTEAVNYLIALRDLFLMDEVAHG